MKHSVVWPIAGVLALAVLVFGLASLLAQPRANIPGIGPQPIRFVVAHATAGQVLVLDSMTGQVYEFREKDFKKPSELPRVGDGVIRPRFGDRDKDAAPRDRTDKDRDFKDRDFKDKKEGT